MQLQTFISFSYHCTQVFKIIWHYSNQMVFFFNNWVTLHKIIHFFQDFARFLHFLKGLSIVSIRNFICKCCSQLVFGIVAKFWEYCTIPHYIWKAEHVRHNPILIVCKSLVTFSGQVCIELSKIYLPSEDLLKEELTV